MATATATATATETAKEQKVFQFYNHGGHYGDSIFALRFFYNTRSFLKQESIQITYFYDPKFVSNLNELLRYVDPSVVELLPISDPRKNDPINVWMGNDIDGLNHCKDFIEYHCRYYRRIAKLLDLNVPSEYTHFFQPESYLESIYAALPSKFQSIDVLIINSEPRSNQFRYNKYLVERFCRAVHALPLRVVVTTPIGDGIPCTWDDGLTIQDIGAISTHAKFVVGILSGPMTACFNTTTLGNVQKLFLLCNPIYHFPHEKIVLASSVTKLLPLFQAAVGYTLNF